MARNFSHVSRNDAISDNRWIRSNRYCQHRNIITVVDIASEDAQYINDKSPKGRYQRY